jgi:hypothetical protein
MKAKKKLDIAPSRALIQNKQFHIICFRQKSFHLLEATLPSSLKTCDGQASSDSFFGGMFLSKATIDQIPISSAP